MHAGEYVGRGRMTNRSSSQLMLGSLVQISANTLLKVRFCTTGTADVLGALR
jgi:hypothetical protein